jgi:hypothetical protein
VSGQLEEEEEEEEEEYLLHRHEGERLTEEEHGEHARLEELKSSLTGMGPPSSMPFAASVRP